jgi:hypothetical protein
VVQTRLRVSNLSRAVASCSGRQRQFNFEDDAKGMESCFWVAEGAWWNSTADWRAQRAVVDDMVSFGPS